MSLLKKTFDFIHNNPERKQYLTQPIFFKRNRTLTFPVVVSSILNLFKESVEYNISTLLSQLNLKPVTGAAFSLARYKIDLSFFKDLNKIVVDFHQQASSKRWKGFQLIAGDGSTVSLPASRQMKDYFGIYSTSRSGTKSCLAQIFMLFDVYTDVVIDGRISKMADSEKTLLKNCLTDLPVTNSIFILDRGFGYFNICKRFLDQKRNFCIRISGSNSAFGKSIAEESSDDFLTYWIPSEKERRTCREHGQNYQPVKLRVSKVKLPSGEIEILVSSLYDMEAYLLNDIKELYRLRWGIEEGFKKLKPKMKLEQFGSRKPEGIFQEFEAHLFMMNMVALMGNAAQEIVKKKCNKRALCYKYNWQNAFRFVRNKIIELLNKANAHQSINKLIRLISTSVIAIKPDRYFPRVELRKNKTRLHQTYK